MSTPIADEDIQPLLLDVSGITIRICSEEYYKLNADNQDSRLELTANRELFFKPLFVYSIASKSNDLMMQVYQWNEQTELGTMFGSSMGYDLLAIGGGIMNPDLSWISKSRAEVISGDEFCSIAPDFVLEYSPPERLAAWQQRMVEYQRMKTPLGLLINIWDKQVEIYHLGQEPEILESPVSIDCADVMPGFILDLSEVW
jgi:Uma2 family endonuclease